jgi:hypothetical protein
LNAVFLGMKQRWENVEEKKNGQEHNRVHARSHRGFICSAVRRAAGRVAPPQLGRSLSAAGGRMVCNRHDLSGMSMSTMTRIVETATPRGDPSHRERSPLGHQEGRILAMTSRNFLA